MARAPRGLFPQPVRASRSRQAPQTAAVPEVEAEWRFRKLLDDLDAIVWEAEVSPFRFTYVSRQAEQILGHPLERWLYEEGFLNRIIHPSDGDATLDAIWVATGGRDDHKVEMRMIAADGRTVWMSLHTRVLEDDTGRPHRLRGVMVDISSRKSVEEALARSEEQLRHSQKLEAIGKLAGGIAHDFNNILTAIGGHAELLLEELEPGSPNRADAEEIIKATSRATELTGQLLTFGRRQPLEESVVDLNEVVEGLERMLRRLIPEDVELDVRLAPSLGRVHVDTGRLEQVVLNLAVNARDAMPNGGRLMIETRNVVLDPGGGLAVEPGRYVALTVVDTGCGMDAETRSHLFEPFFTTKAAGKGTGLGLATAYGIVRQSGGEIAVESEPGMGATFTVYLPRMEESLAVVEGAQPHAVAGRLPSGATVLLVEDDPVVRESVQVALSHDGHRVLEAASLSEALAVAGELSEPIDLLVTDAELPDVSGSELAARLEAGRPGISVLFTSATDAEPAHAAETPPPSTTSLLPRQTLPDVLAARVRALLEEGRSSGRADERAA